MLDHSWHPAKKRGLKGLMFIPRFVYRFSNIPQDTKCSCCHSPLCLDPCIISSCPSPSIRVNFKTKELRTPTFCIVHFIPYPCWDDCQQLLQVLFTPGEKERILLEAQKNIPGTNGAPTNLPNEINAGFPLDRPDWDYKAEGRERLKVYCRALVAGLKGVTRCPTNLA